jgi:hypothetical protein
LDQIKDNVPELVALFDESTGNRAALRRFHMLGSERLINIRNYTSAENNYLISSSEEVFKDKVSPFVDAWRSRLEKHMSRRKSRYALESDAQVLASIQYLNNVLSPKHERIVLITGSKNLFDAVIAEDITGLPDDEKQLRWVFSNLYLRHPQWIMSHSGFFKVPQAEDTPEAGPRSADAGPKNLEFDLQRWVELLSPVTDAEAMRDDQAGPFLNEKIAKVQDSWSSRIKSIAVAKYREGLNRAKEAGVQKLAKILKRLRENKKWSVENLRIEILRDASSLLSELYRNSSILGLLDVLNEPSKTMPSLCFDSPYDKFNDHYKTLLRLMTGGLEGEPTAGTQELRNLIEKVNADKEIDPTLYHSQIIYAAAYGARGYWGQALTLCDDAIKIADRIEQTKYKFIRGREAAYLAAVACRRSAKDIADFDAAQDYLDQAVRRRNEGEPIDLRFESEGVANSIRRMYFECFHLGRKFDRTELHQEIAELEGLIGRAKARKSNPSASSNGHDAAKWVLRQCYTNLFDLTLILKKEGDATIHQPDLQALFAEFRDSIEDEDRQRDPHAWLVCRIVETLLGVANQRESVLAAIKEAEGKGPPMKYDNERLKMYIELIIQTEK